MSNANRDRSFYAGVALVILGMFLYGLDKVLGHSVTTLDVIWYAMPFTLGGCLMLPKLFPNIFGQAMVTLRLVFGRFFATPSDSDK